MVKKPKKKTDDTTSYRTISLLNCLGKLFKRIINERLIKEINRIELLSDFQYGFRRGRSLNVS